jgi:hypothetical protein
MIKGMTVLAHFMTAYGRAGNTVTIVLNLGNKFKVSGQLHGPAVLPPRLASVCPTAGPRALEKNRQATYV